MPFLFFFFFKQKTAYEISACLVGSEMCIRDRVWGFGKDAEIERPKALQDAKPTKRSYRDREFAVFYKNGLFLQPEAGSKVPACKPHSTQKRKTASLQPLLRYAVSHDGKKSKNVR